MTGWLVGSARVTLHPRYVVLAIIDNIIDISTYRQDYTNTKYLLYDYDLISFLNRPNFCNYRTKSHPNCTIFYSQRAFKSDLDDSQFSRLIKLVAFTHPFLNSDIWSYLNIISRY